ncbi:MAG: TonB-dependent receptor [Bacteroidales bacterium]|nr:TonB-dependent receptor [Bacteroidales bacterium]
MHFIKTIPIGGKALAVCMMVSSLLLAANAASASTSMLTTSNEQQDAVVKVSGQVLDENGVPVSGAYVTVVGTANGTTTDAEGKWTLTAAKGSTLEFSFLGFITETQTVTGPGSITLVMKQDSELLGEVVVVGYGSVKKVNLTGSVAKISPDAMKDRPIATIGEAFQGQLAGVYSSASSGGQPGEDLSIRIRGINTINGTSNPLYVIDGVPRDNMSDLNPSDIASIQILKDASSSAIYGSRGASGVILIETKQGAGKPTVTFDAYYGVQSPERTMDLQNGYEYVAQQMYIRNLNHLRKGGSMSDPMSSRAIADQIPSWWLTKDTFTDWQSEVLRTAPIQSYQVSASTKGDMGSIFMSAGYLDQQGILVGSDYTKTNGRVNASLNISKKLRVGLNLGVSRSVHNMAGGGGKESALHHAIIHSPLVDRDAATRDNGIPSATEVGEIFPSPYLRLVQITDQTEYTRINAALWGEYEIIDGLTFKTLYSNTYDGRKYEYFLPGNINRNGYKSEGSSDSYRIDNWTLQNTLTYDKTIGKHAFNVLLGQSAEKQNYFVISAEASGWTYENLTTLNLAPTPTVASTSKNAYSNASFFGRFSYNYDEKYLFTASVRRDGSSRFGKNHKWGTFPSVSAGWKINKEDFMKNISWLSLLKVRASWGKAGNDNMGSNYPSVAALGSYSTVWNGNLVSGAAPSNMPNEDLKWEATKSLNFGFDFAAFKNRLQLSVDYYINDTEDLLFSKPIPYTTGFSSFTTNIGSVRNSGFEFDLTSANIVSGDFSWTSNVNLSHNTNKVTDMGGQQVLDVTSWSQKYRTEVGKPLSQFLAYKTIGILTSDCFDSNGNATVPILAGQEEGNYRYQDTNNDGKITTDDMVVCGDNFPDLVYGITNKFAYKNFELSVLVQGQVGGEIMYIGGRHNNLGNSGRNSYRHWLTSYKPDFEAKYGAGENPVPVEYCRQHGIDMSWDGKTPFAFGQSGGGVADDNRIFSTTYLRIKNITLSYTLPASLLKKVNMKGAKVYAAMDNVYIFTDYIGYTPESNTNGNGTTRLGVDYSTYPLSRRLIFGASLTF